MYVPERYDINSFSANGVHYPLDQYLRLIGKPTTSDIAKVLLLWDPIFRKTKNTDEIKKYGCDQKIADL